MKSILIISPWLGKIDRGAETFARELSERLASGWKVTLVTGGKVNITNPNLEVIDCSDFTPGKWYGQFCAIYNYLIKNNHNSLFSLPFKIISRLWDYIYYIHPEVVYQGMFMKYLDRKIDLNRKWDVVFPQNGIMGIKWADRSRKINGCKVIYTGHGGVGRGEYLVLKYKPDAYIGISERAAQWASQYSNKVHLIQNGVSSNKFHACWYAKRDHVTVLSVGALTSFKRHELTIKAVSLIPHAKLIIVGVGELRLQLECICEKYIPGRYKIMSVPYEEIASVYKMASVFVLPSINEPMGIVYLEALSSGLPIVAPDDELRRKLLKEHADYVDVTDPIEYAKKIESALATNQPNIAGLDYAVENFSWNSVAEKYHGVFHAMGL